MAKTARKSGDLPRKQAGHSSLFVPLPRLARYGRAEQVRSPPMRLRLRIRIWTKFESATGNFRASRSRKLDVLPDMPDIRDRTYRPILRALQPVIDPQILFAVRDQAKNSQLHRICSRACD